MQYQRFDPTTCGFPKPRVPVLPALRWQSLGRGTQSEFRQLGTHANACDFTLGRYALAQAYLQCGVGRQGTLLAPAYHCRTMLDPAISLGADIELYHLALDLSPDLASLADCVSRCAQPVKALLVSHYFGFSQNLEPLVEFCAQHGLALIEDCSHALFNLAAAGAGGARHAIGHTGRFGIASPYKFFPSEDGGVLWANGDYRLQTSQQRTPRIIQELKGLLHAVQRAQAGTEEPDVNQLDAQISAVSGKLQLTGRDQTLQSAAPSPYYVSGEAHLKNLRGSRWIMRHTNVKRLVDRRRANYRQWLAAIAGLPHCQALFPELPADCVPYMFPLLIERPEIHFFALKQLGVPVWRWDDMAVSTCPVATSYRLTLLHLPCHQELSERQMTWLTTAVQKVFRQLPVGGTA